jgi:Tol biopolymer transport system component
MEDMQRVDLNGNAAQLTHGKQVHDAQWSPDGTYIDYFDVLSTARMGTLHQINVTTGIDRSTAIGVTTDPAPTWSADSQHLLYSTGVHIFFTNMQTTQSPQQLKLQGPVSAFTWFTTSSQQLVVSIGDGQDGTYLIDIQNHTTIQIDKEDFKGPISWTEIP